MNGWQIFRGQVANLICACLRMRSQVPWLADREADARAFSVVRCFGEGLSDGLGEVGAVGGVHSAVTEDEGDAVCRGRHWIILIRTTEDGLFEAR